MGEGGVGPGGWGRVSAFVRAGPISSGVAWRCLRHEESLSPRSPARPARESYVTHG